MIRSVLSQTYSGWQLCLADGSDEEHDDVEEICQMYAARDSRICYRRLDRNYGISGRHEKRTSPGYMRRLQYVQNMTAVTAACMMVRRDVWDELSGLDESFAVSFNDIDFCMRVRRAGYLIVWTPYVFNRTARAMLVRLDPDVHGIELHDWMAYQVVACTGRVVYDAHSHMSYSQHGDNAIGAVRDPQRERLRKVRSFWSGPMRNSRERSARRIEAVYGELLTPQNRELVSDFAHYRQSVLRRFRLLTKRARIIGEIKRHLFRLLVICGRL